MTAHDASTQQQQQQVLPLAAELLNDEGGSSESLNDATKPAAAPENHSRTGVALDGTPLEFKRPSTQDLHKLGMGEWVARKSVSLALVALDGNAATDEGDAVGNAPLAGSVVEAVGGSSVATRACLLRHRRAVGVSEAVEHVLLDETIAQFLNEGAKLSQLRVEADDSRQSLAFYKLHGLVRSGSARGELPEGRVVLSGDRDAGLEAIEASLAGGAVSAVVMNLKARLLHDKGDLQAAVGAYLKALEMDPLRSEIFRGLGGAYQSQGQHQMAFASYQQAINVAPNDLLAYLKLGMLYEELAVGKYEEAGGHAIRCYEYYLQHSHSEDTDVLTRMGNLQVLRLDPSSAVESYGRALEMDPSLANVWFNLANAHLKMGQEEEAARCLRQKLKLEPDSGVSAKYLLASLESDPERLTRDDQLAYARELFDYYAPTYDDHVRKKLLYTGPRLLRQNLKEVYNATFQAFPEEIRSSHNGDVLSYLNGSLDILDLGCGTGLIGSWFKDYANKIVGVDISPTMLDMATKKGCYHELRRGDVVAYLAASEAQQFDLVVAAETLQYLGPVEGVFADAFKVLKPGGYFSFTVDRREVEEEEMEHGDEDAGGERISQTAGPALGYSLKSDGTYAYSRGYLEELARKNGYETVILKRHSTMVQRGEAAPGYMGVLRKPM
eukprot:jgi/Undpi1/1242/HiC_scaffold_108.g14156.m1